MPPRLLTRREFLHESVIACAATAAVPLAGRPPTAADDYEVLFLGDVHFDRLAHHDMQWLEREKPNDVAQVQNYSRLTREVWPLTLGRLRASVAAARGTVAPVALCMLSGRGAYSPEQVNGGAGVRARHRGRSSRRGRRRSAVHQGIRIR